MSDEMTVLDVEGNPKLLIDKDNNIVSAHSCTFTKFDEDSQCTICSRTLGSVIDLGEIPVLILPEENKGE